MRIHQNGPLDKLMQFMRSSISRIITYGWIKEFMRPVLDSHKINKIQSKMSLYGIWKANPHYYSV